MPSVYNLSVTAIILFRKYVVVRKLTLKVLAWLLHLRTAIFVCRIRNKDRGLIGTISAAIF
jgi:hypothetical protein